MNRITVFLILLCLCCCKSSKLTTSAVSSDSLSVTESLKASQVTVIPESTVTLTIPVADLLSLPVTASIASSSNNATASVRIRADTVYVDARCDSLQVVIYEYEKRINEQNQFTYTNSEEQNTSAIMPRDRFSLKWFAIGICCGLIILTIFLLTFKR